MYSQYNPYQGCSNMTFGQNYGYNGQRPSGQQYTNKVQNFAPKAQPLYDAQGNLVTIGVATRKRDYGDLLECKIKCTKCKEE